MENTSENILKIGTVLQEKWVILEFVAGGGMGEIYRAHQIHLKRDEALKMFAREKLFKACGEDPKEIETLLERFQIEVQTMAQIRHPNVVQIYDTGACSLNREGESLSVQYIAMEYIPGGTLRSTMSEEGFHPEEGLTKEWINDYYLPLLEGLRKLHDSGIVHRDLKPENILLDGKTPKIGDFGICRSHRAKPVTDSMDMKGTLAYMPPEQFYDFKRADQRADIYSLGKILFEAVEGRTGKIVPFRSVGLKDPLSPFFKGLDRIIRSCTSEEKEGRPSSVEELQGLLLPVIRGTASSRARSVRQQYRPRLFLPALLILVALIGLWQSLDGGWLYRFYFEKVGAVRNISVPSGNVLPRSLEAQDGSTLHLIQGGELVLPSSFSNRSERELKIAPFYMGEAQITNYQYMEFLNHVLPRVKVEGNVVKGDGQIWLLLGEVIQGYEPIVFRNGKFHVNKPAHSACPVLRVTGYGASSYARYYGERLPTRDEWMFALKMGALEGPKAGAGENRESYSEDTKDLFPSPLMIMKPNALGLRGLYEQIAEWVTQGAGSESLKGTEYVVMGEKSKGQEDEVPSALVRQPWEAYENVGFRCVLDVPKTGP